MKKPVIITVVIVLLLAGAGTGIYFLSTGKAGAKEESVYTDSAAVLTGRTDAQNCYSGVVKTPDPVKIQKDNTKTVKEMLVSEGERIETGAPLFSYDTEELELNVKMGELEVENMNNDISSMRSQISELERERDKQKGDDRASYVLQIQSLENDISRQEYNIKVKNTELDNLKKSVEAASVKSETAGIIQDINRNADSANQEAFITILPDSELQIEGTVSEINRSSLEEGKAVIVRSRMNRSLTWKGTITELDSEFIKSSEESDRANEASQYHFYVKTEPAADTEGKTELMSGQHILIELDEGQLEEQSGIWLAEGYICDKDGDAPYVWSVDAKNQIQKKEVTLGTYLQHIKKYEITSGLAESDYIAYPTDTIREGLKAIKNELSDNPEDNNWEENIESSEALESDETEAESDETGDTEDTGDTESEVTEETAETEETIEETTEETTEQTTEETTEETTEQTTEETTEETTEQTTEQGTLPPISSNRLQQQAASISQMFSDLWHSIIGKDRVTE